MTLSERSNAVATEKELAALQSCITNKLEPNNVADHRLAGVIGDTPSHYSKSPALWNAAFRFLNINALYLPLDVEEKRLGELASVLRNSESFLGINVTVPHKQKIMDYLDALDDSAARIQAVNTVVRSADGRLVGFNTDGEGFVKSVLEPQPGEAGSVLDSFKDISVLLLGAGGSARAVAFHVADLLNKGRLLICNRTLEHARDLAEEIRKAGCNASAIKEDELSHWAPQMQLIINCTTKGQGGARELDQGKTISLEFYSALAPAHPVAVPPSRAADFREESKASEADIKNNNAASLELATSIPRHVCFYDLVYFPEQTVFLRHAIQTGHVAMNGKGMIINQAVISFCERICRAELQSREIDKPETARQVLEVMYGAW